MKHRAGWIVATVAAAALPWACSEAGPGPLNGATGGATTTQPSTSGAGGADCQAILPAGACTDCLMASCCHQLSACNNDPGSCLDCFQGNIDGGPCTDPGTAPLFASLSMCRDMGCEGPCASPSASPDPACDAPAVAPSKGACFGADAGSCNPVTSTGCTGPGETCDHGSGGFQCFSPPPPNTAATCAACSATLQCAPGNACVSTGKCARYCCDDGDCGSGRCDKTLAKDPDVGLCVEKPGPVDAGGG